VTLQIAFGYSPVAVASECALDSPPPRFMGAEGGRGFCRSY